MFGWVKECLTSSHSVVLINNQPRRLFKVKRGLKHRCPLSPLLFSLTTDILSRSLKLVTRFGSGIGEQERWEVGALQYADVTLICCRTLRREIRCLKLCLIGFRMVSGVQTNLSKTKVFYIRQTEGKKEEIAGVLG